MVKRSLLLLALVGCVGDPIGGGGGQPMPSGDPGPAPDPGAGSGSGSGSGAGSGSGSGSAAPTPMTATLYLHARNVKQCDEEFACKSSYPGDPANPGASFAQMYGATPSDCYQFADNYDQLSAVEADITSGYITFNATYAADCVATLSFPSSCTDFWTSGPILPPSCGNTMRGTVADGGLCHVDFDCLEGGSTCDPGSHVCTPTGANGG